MEEKSKSIVISKQALSRMPYYLQYLNELRKDGSTIISSPNVAAKLKLNEVLVRKDFAAISSTKGKPKTGFLVDNLIKDIETFLGCNNINEAVLIGVGSLGKALLSYTGFEKYGVRIVAAFDSNEEIIGSEISGKMVFSIDELQKVCRRLKIHIGIITVPAENAQEVCDMLIQSNILALWNFAPTSLNVPTNILVQNENMAASLAMLSKHLEENINSMGDI